MRRRSVACRPRQTRRYVAGCLRGWRCRESHGDGRRHMSRRCLRLGPYGPAVTAGSLSRPPGWNGSRAVRPEPLSGRGIDGRNQCRGLARRQAARPCAWRGGSSGSVAQADGRYCIGSRHVREARRSGAEDAHRKSGLLPRLAFECRPGIERELTWPFPTQQDQTRPDRNRAGREQTRPDQARPGQARPGQTRPD